MQITGPYIYISRTGTFNNKSLVKNKEGKVFPSQAR